MGDKINKWTFQENPVFFSYFQVHFLYDISRLIVKWENSDFTGGKPGRHHLNLEIKVKITSNVTVTSWTLWCDLPKRTQNHFYGVLAKDIWHQHNHEKREKQTEQHIIRQLTNTVLCNNVTQREAWENAQIRGHSGDPVAALDFGAVQRYLWKTYTKR